MLVLVLVMLVLTKHSSGVVRSGAITRWSTFSNVVITSNTLSVTENVRSTSQCAMLCLEMQACISMFYRQVSRRCQFHDVLFLSPQDGEEEVGTEYYSLTAGSCPAGYINARPPGLCYRHPLKRIPHGEAAADCASNGEHLIVIDNQEKQDHIRKQITSSSVSLLHGTYIDGSVAENEGTWVYHDGRPMEYFVWKDSYPRNDAPQRDFLAASKGNGDLLWMDVLSTNSKYYLCEMDTRIDTL